MEDEKPREGAYNPPSLPRSVEQWPDHLYKVWHDITSRTGDPDKAEDDVRVMVRAGVLPAYDTMAIVGVD